MLSDILVSINSGNLYIALIRPVFDFLSKPRKFFLLRVISKLSYLFSINSGRIYIALTRPMFASFSNAAYN